NWKPPTVLPSRANVRTSSWSFVRFITATASLLAATDRWSAPDPVFIHGSGIAAVTQADSIGRPSTGGGGGPSATGPTGPSAGPPSIAVTGPPSPGPIFPGPSPRSRLRLEQ